ncbi:MAG: hypothetical protein ACKOSR_03590 [Flavobacteriales bacterium]
MNKILLGISMIALFAITMVMSGCKKNKDKKTVAIVTVVDEDGAVVVGASVRLYAVPSENPPPPNAIRFDTTQVSNGAGSVTFDFSDFYEQGQAGFAVLDIEATKGSLDGAGIIKIVELETTEETVVMK